LTLHVTPLVLVEHVVLGPEPHVRRHRNHYAAALGEDIAGVPEGREIIVDMLDDVEEANGLETFVRDGGKILGGTLDHLRQATVLTDLDGNG
jgi:hypothetical protein